MSAAIEPITIGLGRSPLLLATALNTFFADNNPLSLIDIETLRRTERTQHIMQIEVTYAEGTGTYSAQVFATDDDQTADEKADAFFVTDANFRPFKVLDISQELRRSLLQDAVIIIGTTNFSMDLGQGSRRLVLVEASADIAADSSGLATVQGAAGDLGRSITVVNKSNALWGTGVPGWAVVNVVDGAAGGWWGWPSCC